MEFSDPFRKFFIPDINLCDYLNEDSQFSMVAGEFVDIYSQQIEQWDCVVTCFFLDTANNIL